MKKSLQINIRVTPEEMAELKSKAGLVPVSKWMLTRCLGPEPVQPSSALTDNPSDPPWRQVELEHEAAGFRKADPKPVKKEKVGKGKKPQPEPTTPKTIVEQSCRQCGRPAGEFHDLRCRLFAVGKRI